MGGMKGTVFPKLPGTSSLMSQEEEPGSSTIYCIGRSWAGLLVTETPAGDSNENHAPSPEPSQCDSSVRGKWGGLLCSLPEEGKDNKAQ